MDRPRFLSSAIPVAAAAIGVVACALTIRALIPAYATARSGRLDAGYLASDDCRKCHEQNYSTWHRTFHRTMTREATAENVLGDFAHQNTLVYQGIRADMVEEHGRYWMKLTGANGKRQELEIVRTVGSRRIQQYLTKAGDAWLRLPVAYDLVQHRWMHLNGSFFNPDGTAFNEHVAEWNANCVFCHNVKAQPGFDWDKKSWNTEVTELGIACGGCHGPGGKHAQKALSPVTRYRWYLGDITAAAMAITNPSRLDSDRAAMICAHCHAQRLPNPAGRIRTILSEGDPFNAGQDLKEFYQPVQRDSKVGEFSFAPRFWNDGSPRLTAYEYQAMIRSKCFTAGKPGARITCISCHSMHEGDPRGQLTAEKRGHAACTQCHEQFRGNAQLTAHTKHRADSTGSLCYNCHMPANVYGVMSAHPTHEITIPRPDETIRFGKPNACNQCHLDWSVNHAIAKAAELWPKDFQVKLQHDRRFDEPEGQRALFAGDAVTRALTAAAMTPARDETAPLLIEAMRDSYPVVRYFAANALAARYTELPKPDYLATSVDRETVLKSWETNFPPDRINEAKSTRERLSATRQEQDVQVGE
jgi:predicted CXXCH cytochrome family protein